MKIQLNTNLVPIFSGTYESVWTINDYGDDGAEMNTVYDHKDLMKGIAREYQNHADYIKDEFNIDFIKKIKFSGEFSSPAYYNFSTDKLDFTVTVDKRLLMKKLKELEYDDNFDTFLKEHYTSYDGFMSFTPNNYHGILEEIKTEGREFEQSIGAVIRYLIPEELLSGDFYQTIEGQIYEDWRGNGYGGTNYHVECWKCEETLEYPYEHECKEDEPDCLHNYEDGICKTCGWVAKNETVPENQLPLI